MSSSQKSKQKTLFQAWKKPADPPRNGSHSNGIKKENKKIYSAEDVIDMASDSEMIDLTDDDLVEAAELFESTLNDPAPSTSSLNSAAVENLPGFDNSLGHIWVYPTNYPLRDYQFSIVKNALFKNTLVSLPTGLGKTFIAAVVMYNYYRWYPEGKIIFMAPTKPLVSQQIEACYKIMGIPMEDQAEITGMTTSVHKREALWLSKRVFFLTPQVLSNDLARGACPAQQIKCVVIDEAHKAQGNHSYCQVINQLASVSRQFRVLALSATPGTDVRSVQQVITNLLISHLEIRSEDSIDIQQYSHQRNVQKVVCKLDERMLKMKQNFLKVIETFTRNLVSRRVLFDRDASSYTKYGILMSRDQYRRDPPSGLSKYEMGSIEGDFATCISLYHGLELLGQHGMRSFYIFIKSMMEGDKGNYRSKTVLGANTLFRDIFNELASMFGTSPNPTVQFSQATQPQSNFSTQGRPYVYSHPKIAKLEEIVIKHFQNFVSSGENDATRVMIFCQYRDSVQEITELLQKHRPLIRPMQFVGHSTASGKVVKFTQKHQLQVVSKFRGGGYNTLVSTCVGEEGLDIGDVDLIVCFDAHKSPIRLIQRMGRTGRKRKGRIVMLVTEGKEERDYNSSVSSKKSILKAITGNSGRSLQLYPHNPRMIPVGLNPTPYKMFMTVKDRSGTLPKKGGKKQKMESKDISLLMKNAENKNSVFLNDQQAREWNETMRLTAKEREKVKILPTGGRMMCLNKSNMNSPARQNTLSLSEWTVWQTRLQPATVSGHSRTAQNFVELMEICDVVKQSDENNFDENLAPFLGGKYDREKMGGERKDKMDQFLVPKDATKKPEMIKNKNAKKKTKTKEKDKNAEKELSSEADFAPKIRPKFIPPVKSNFRKKLSLFAAEDDLNPSPKNSVDDTLTGIDSILPDPDVIEESSNDSSTKGDCWGGEEGKKKEGLGESVMVSGRDSKDDPGENSSFVKPELQSLKGKQTLKRNLNDRNNESPFNNKSSLGIADNLSVLASQTPNLEEPCTSKERQEVRVPTPPSLDSISLDFLDDFKDPLSDDSEDDDFASKPLNRACFSLGKENIKKVQETVQPTTETSRTTEQQASTSCWKREKGKDEPEGHEILTEQEEVPKTIPGPDRSVGMSHCDDISKEERISKESVKHESMEPDDVEIPLSQTNRPSPRPKAPTDNNDTSCMLDTSADMFAPQFNLNFEFEDDPRSLTPEHDIQDDLNKGVISDGTLSSPVLENKRKFENSQTPDLSISENNRKSRLAQNTMTQRVENRALFADLPKLQNIDHVPIAEVKPRRSFIDVEEKKEEDADDVPEEMSYIEDIFQDDFDDSHMRNRNASSSNVDSLKRKRQSPEERSDFVSKRRKEMVSTNVSFTGEYKEPPVIQDSPEFSVPTFDMAESSDTDESPLIVKRKKRNGNMRAKVLFSQDADDRDTPSSDDELLSQLTDENIFNDRKKIAQMDRLEQTHESPIQFPTRTGQIRNLNIGKKHSTPKCEFRYVDDGSSDDDEFQSSRKDQNKVTKEKVTVNPRARSSEKNLHHIRNLVDDEAEVSIDGTHRVSSDETEIDDPEAAEEMRDFVNDATQLTQHVGDESHVDEEAMYLHGGHGIFKQPSEFQANNGKFKLAYGVGNDLDVFSQPVAPDVSGYEEDSFICDDEEEEIEEDHTSLGEVTLLDNVSHSSHSKKRVTRRQAQLNRLRKMNYESSPLAQPTIKRTVAVNKGKNTQRKRIVCMDDSTDSIESENRTTETKNDIGKKDESSDTRNKWTCQACTLLNLPSSQICELCDCEKPTLKLGKTDPNVQTESWSCPMCTYINQGKNTQCDMCGEIRTETRTSGHKTESMEGKMKSMEYKSQTSDKVCKSNFSDKGISEKGVEETQLDYSPVTISATPVLKQGHKEARRKLHVSTTAASKQQGRKSNPETKCVSQASNYSISSSADDREERLKKCRQKQMEFKARKERRRSEQGVSNQQDAATTSMPEEKSGPMCSSTSVLSSTKTRLKFESPTHGPTGTTHMTSATTNSSKYKVLLVDSKELSSCQKIITTLRSKHDVEVVVASLGHCDYIVGRGTAVERKVASDFSQVSNRQKLIERFRHLHTNYDRVYLIIEQDRSKRNEVSGGRQNMHSAYYNATMCTLTQANVRVLHSSSEADTADILQTLITREKGLKRSVEFEVAQKASDPKYRSLLRIYTSIPKISFVSALYLCLNFKSFKEVSSSSVEKLIRSAYLSTCSAAEVYNFFRRKFDLQMTPSR